MKRVFLSLALLLSAAVAHAADNTDLYSCTAKSAALVKHLFATQEEKVLAQMKSVRMIVGQDQTAEAPLFEVKVQGLASDGSQVATYTLRRIALVQSDRSNAASVTYSPTRTTGRVKSKTDELKGVADARAFNLFIPHSLNGKISFIQINNGTAPVESASMSCDLLNVDTSVPEKVVLNGMTEAEQLHVIRAMQRMLPTNWDWREDDAELKVPDGMVSDAIEQILAHAVNMNLTEEDVRKHSYVSKDETVSITKGADRCKSVKLQSLKPVRDMAGNTFAYDASVRCKGVAVVTKGKDYEGKDYVEDHSLSMSDVYLTSKAVLFGSAVVQASRIYKEDNE